VKTEEELEFERKIASLKEERSKLYELKQQKR